MRFRSGTLRRPANFIDINGEGFQRMVVSAAEYRQYAAECLALSERLSNPLDKARLIQMAQDFLSMAEKRDFLSMAEKEERSMKE